MKTLLSFVLLLITAAAFAQNTGTVVGKLTDKDYNNEPLAFANVIIKGTSTGTTSDFDGLYTLENLEIGTYTLVFSFVGYETVEIPNVNVVADKVTTVNVPMGASAAALDEVVIKTTVRRESEVALLIEQKKAVEIKESIGGDQMTRMGVSNASTATSKISGVNTVDAGGVFVRGLGDRYLYTMINDLPVPSDDVEKKNLDLSVVPSRLIQSLSVSKTASSKLNADQTSGVINIDTKELTKNELLAASLGSSVNTSVTQDGTFSNFKVSPNNENVTLGFYSNKLMPEEAILAQTWSPQTVSTPVNQSFAVSYGKRVNDKLRILASVGQSSSFDYRNGVFRQFRSNFIDDTIPDAIRWRKQVSTSALVNAEYRINDNNKLRATSILINTVKDEVFEGGRAGNATIFEETNPAEGLFQFIRDQNIKKTFLSVNQLFGEHKLSEKNTLTYGIGFNYLSADEPNRIRNEVNFNPSFVQLGRNGGFQQRKSAQFIEDFDYVARINNQIQFVEEDTKTIQLNLGANYRNRSRGFQSVFVGVQETSTNAINPESIDRISEIFTQTNFDNNLLKLNLLTPDLYIGELETLAGYVDFIGVFGKITLEAGARFQNDNIYVLFDVNNFAGRIGETNKDYNRLYPSLNVKYALTENSSLRFAGSTSTTLPEFKEIAPFEYVSPTGQITRGNPDIEASRNATFDLKYEVFPSREQLFSLTGFYKHIKNPINKVQDRGSAGVFSYFNTSERARVFGLELESRFQIFGGEDLPSLKLIFNAARLWHTQDLKEIRDANGNFIRTFRYKGLTETRLQGAADWIVNSSLGFNTQSEMPFSATLTANYSSEKVFALGAPEIQSSSDINYNDAIVENGFVTLDMVLSKQLSKRWELRVSGRNLLNPTIKRTQLVKPSTTGIETKETVLSYKNGAQIGASLNFKID